MDTGRAVSDQNLPLEAFALPGWYADLNLDYVIVVSELGVKYSEAHRARYDALSSIDKGDFPEYQNTLQKHFQEGFIVSSQPLEVSAQILRDIDIIDLLR